jgi:hypothetical protein
MVVPELGSVTAPISSVGEASVYQMRPSGPDVIACTPLRTPASDRRNLDGQLDRLSDQQRDEVVQRLVRMVDAGLLAS